MTLVKLSSKGQIVLPKGIRAELGLVPGTLLKITCQGRQIVLEPVAASTIDRLHGKFSGVTLLDDLEAEHRQEIEREHRA